MALREKIYSNQFIRYSFVGAIGTLGHYLTLIILADAAGVNAVLASALGFTVGAFINYYLNRRYTFKSGLPHSVGMTKFFTVALAGLGVNTLVMLILIERFAWHYLFAQLAATGVVLIGTFLANRLWTFKPIRETG